ncbi:geranylgeranyl pyrophosphate synthetase [Puccinia graminis f. sp. tritici]|uniref:(2E,6E)-farnesyl diphosphate synthase n=1 Tax=Puccinia graminis f. sp. tritici TaxID=56615 RepID=A0A5B0RPP1_PUCGR|nr:geranylgeranyl pyrophosphate synthetase [Puccinia graminis f. sp. tritici]
MLRWPSQEVGIWSLLGDMAAHLESQTNQLFPLSDLPSTSTRLDNGGLFQINGIEERYSNFFERMKQNNPDWSEPQERILLEPFTYLTSTPGKEIRSMMIDAFNHWLSVPTEQLNIVKRIVGLLHTASLLMDDVEDGSELRRGIPGAYCLPAPRLLNTF